LLTRELSVLVEPSDPVEKGRRALGSVSYRHQKNAIRTERHLAGS